MDHDCSGCLGTKFQGANLTCNRCYRPFYLECLKDRAEILYLIGALNSYSQTGFSPTTLQTKIQKLFGAKTLLEFNCLKCKESGTFLDALNQAKNDLREEHKKELQQKIVELEMYRDEINKNREALAQMENVKVQYNTQINQLQSDLSNVSSKLAEVEVINADLQNQILNAEQHKMDGIDYDNGVNTAEVKKIMNRFDVLSNDIEARMRLESDKIIRAIHDANDEVNPNAKKRKSNDHYNTLAPTTSAPQIDLTHEGQGLKTKLRPPLMKENDKRDVYHIHISLFDGKHTEQQIESYICENTGISVNGLFKVTKLLSKKRNLNGNDDYCSFKITTIHHEIYKKISNTALWEPDFQVRDFTDSPPKENRPSLNRPATDVRQQKPQFVTKNLQQNKFPKRNEHVEQRKIANMGTARNKHLVNVQMTPTRHNQKIYSPRKIFPQNRTVRNPTAAAQSTSALPVPDFQQPYIIFPTSQMEQNFQMAPGYHPQMAIQPQTQQLLQRQQQSQQQQNNQ